jgi:hypothetical protein
MSDTNLNNRVDEDPIATSVATGIPIGTEISIENVGNWPINYSIGIPKPDPETAGFRCIAPRADILFDPGENEIWLWTADALTVSYVNVEN